MTQRAFGVRALPTVFVIDSASVIRDVSVDFNPRKEVEAIYALFPTALFSREPAP